MSVVVRGVAAAVAVCVLAGAGRAETPAPKSPAATPWGVNLAGFVASDFRYRGRTLSALGPAVLGQIEPYYGWLFAGFLAATSDLSIKSHGLMNVYGGIRPTFGPVTAEMRLTWKIFPDSRIPGTAVRATYDYVEAAFRPSWTINELLSWRGEVTFSPSYANTSASELFISTSATLSAPRHWLPAGIGAYASAEFARDRFGITIGNVDLPDFFTWNAGLGLGYSGFTFDLRYYDSTLSREDCAILTSDPSATPGGFASPVNPRGLQSNWCGTAFVAKLTYALSVPGKP